MDFTEPRLVHKLEQKSNLKRVTVAREALSSISGNPNVNGLFVTDPALILREHKAASYKVVHRLRKKNGVVNSGDLQIA